MSQICVSLSLFTDASDLMKACFSGDAATVEKLLSENVNIYKPFETYSECFFVPMMTAFLSKNEKIVASLLDVYERDLEILKETKYMKALVAMPEDQTKDVFDSIEKDDYGKSDKFIPVLMKNSTNQTPKLVFLRKSLKNKDDLSFKIAKILEEKNGFCDLNFIATFHHYKENFLHFAASLGMKSIVDRLLQNQKFDKKLIMEGDNSPLHYAILAGNLNIVDMLLTNIDDSVPWDDKSFLLEAAKSENLKALDFVLKKSGRKLNEVLGTIFTVTKFYEKETFECLFHVISRSSNFEKFVDFYRDSITKESFCLQDGDGNTILHLVVMQSVLKLAKKIQLISRIVEKCPESLMIENNDHQLPLHLSALEDVKGHRLYHHLTKLTAKQSGNSEIFFANIDGAISTLEKSIEVNKSLSGEYWKLFEGVLKSHGPRLLQKCITANKTHSTLKGFYSTSVKIDPNEFYDGKNAFLTMIEYDVNKMWYTKPGDGVFNRMKVLMEVRFFFEVFSEDLK